MLLNLLYAYSPEMVDFNILFQFYDCFWREICHASHAVIPEIPWFLFWYNFSDKLHKEQDSFHFLEKFHLIRKIEFVLT